MRVRRRDVGADAQIVLIKDHAEALIEGQINLLPRAEMDVAGQQNLDVIVAVALAKQVGIRYPDVPPLHIETPPPYQ